MQRLAASVALGTILVFGLPAAAADFSGKRIEWIIPFKEGGGTDVWARFYAPFLSAALPGQPTLVVKNVPGGGSTTGANLFHQRAEPDGLMLLGSSGSTQFPYLLDDPRVRYEYKDMTPLLASPSGGVVYVNPELGIKDASEIDKLKDVALNFASQGATSLDLVPQLSFELLGLDVNPVFGMQGRGAARLAFERGETKIDYQTSSGYLTKVVPLVEEGKAVPLYTLGMLDDEGNLTRDPTFPDLPHFGEVYEAMHGKKPSGPGWDAYKAFVTAGYGAQKGLFVPKDTPKEIVETYRDALDKVVSDPEFRKAAQEELGDYPQLTGERAKRLVGQAINIDPEAKQWVKDWLTRKYNVQF